MMKNVYQGIVVSDQRIYFFRYSISSSENADKTDIPLSRDKDRRLSYNESSNAIKLLE